jgi:hypothetical protein
MYVRLHVKCLLFLSDFNAGQIFEKYSNVRFHENPSSGNRVVLCGRTDGQTDRNVVTFRNFANAPNKTLEMMNITTFFYVIKYRLVP